MRHGEPGDHAHAEPGGDQRLDRDLVVGGEPDLRGEAGQPVGVDDDAVPGAGRRPADVRLQGGDCRTEIFQ